MAIFLLILGLVLFIGLVVLHEFGHFIVARRNGVIPEEFGIGFPPRIWGKQMKGGYEFSINLLPLGGFVKLKGEHDADKKPGTFGAASLWSKTKIMLAGITLNLIAALVIFTVLALVGMPRVITKDNGLINENQYTVASNTKVVSNDVIIGDVEANSPASKIGLQPGDRLLTLQSKSITTSSQLVNTTKQYAGQPVTITYQHNSQTKQGTATFRTKQAVDASLKTNNPKGYLGVIDPVDYTVQRSTWSAPVVAVGLTAQLTRLTLSGLWSAIKGFGSFLAGLFTANKVARQNGQTIATSEVGGPVAIFFILQSGTRLGLGFIMFIIGYISLALAIVNLLPIAAFDGGRFYLIFISRKIFRRPLSRSMEEKIVGSSFAFLMVLFVLITIVDIHRH